jgi:LysR family transcriptional regulator for metE and metH
LPSWALLEYAERGYVIPCPFGEHWIWGAVYTATRTADRSLAFMRDLLHIARHRSYRSLKGPQVRVNAPAGGAAQALSPRYLRTLSGRGAD